MLLSTGDAEALVDVEEVVEPEGAADGVGGSSAYVMSIRHRHRCAHYS
jgi:hypothetical protein